MVAVDLLKKLKLELNSLVSLPPFLSVFLTIKAPANNTFAAKFDRAKFEDTLKRKFFYIQSGEIYGGGPRAMCWYVYIDLLNGFNQAIQW